MISKKDPSAVANPVLETPTGERNAVMTLRTKNEEKKLTRLASTIPTHAQVTSV
jgi:hypothetical protein